MRGEQTDLESGKLHEGWGVPVLNEYRATLAAHYLDGCAAWIYGRSTTFPRGNT